MYAVPDVEEVVAVARSLGIHLGPTRPSSTGSISWSSWTRSTRSCRRASRSRRRRWLSPARTPACKPSASEDPLNAWMWKCSIAGEAEGLLAGKTVSYKDHIAVAGVPMSFGSFALEGSSRISTPPS